MNLRDIDLQKFLMEYNPFKKTALKRIDLSKPMSTLLNKGLLDNETNLDFGTGHGVDVKIIKKQYSKSNNLNIVGYDLFNEDFYKPELLKDKHYDNLTSFYVLNVMPSLEYQQKLIELFRNLADNIYVCVRADSKSIKDTWVKVEEWDGYITPKLSFQRFYDREKVKKYFGNVEYIVDNSSFKLFKLKQK